MPLHGMFRERIPGLANSAAAARKRMAAFMMICSVVFGGDERRFLDRMILFALTLVNSRTSPKIT